MKNLCSDVPSGPPYIWHVNFVTRFLWIALNIKSSLIFRISSSEIPKERRWSKKSIAASSRLHPNTRRAPERLTERLSMWYNAFGRNISCGEKYFLRKKIFLAEKIYFLRRKIYFLRKKIFLAEKNIFLAEKNISCRKKVFLAEKNISCGKKYISCGEKFFSCGEKFISCGEKYISCGEKYFLRKKKYFLRKNIFIPCYQ